MGKNRMKKTGILLAGKKHEESVTESSFLPDGASESLLLRRGLLRCSRLLRLCPGRGTGGIEG